MPIHKPHRQEKKKKKWKNLLFLNRKNHWRINTQRGCPQETNTQAEFWQKAQQRGTILECMGFFKIWFWLTSMGRAHDILSYVGFYHGSHSFVHLHNLTCLFWQWHKIVHKTQSQRRVRVAQPMAPREVVFWKGNWFKKLPDPKFQAWVRLSACVWLWDGVCPCCHLLKGLSHRVLFVRTNRPATEDGRRELIPQTCSDGLSSKKHRLDHLPNPIQPQIPDTPPPAHSLVSRTVHVPSYSPKIIHLRALHKFIAVGWWSMQARMPSGRSRRGPAFNTGRRERRTCDLHSSH